MAQNPPVSRPPSAPQYTLTNINQQETYDAGPDGRPTLGYRVSFTTPSNVRASVFVPAADYTVQNVQAAMLAKAHQLEQVQQLGS